MLIDLFRCMFELGIWKQNILLHNSPLWLKQLALTHSQKSAVKCLKRVIVFLGKTHLLSMLLTMLSIHLCINSIMAVNKGGFIWPWRPPWYGLKRHLQFGIEMSFNWVDPVTQNSTQTQLIMQYTQRAWYYACTDPEQSNYIMTA